MKRNTMAYMTIFILCISSFLLTQHSNIFAQSLHRMGPSGGAGGGGFGDQNQIPKNPKVEAVKIRYGALIDAVQIIVKGANTEKHGGDGGKEVTWPSGGLKENEYITRISGQSGEYVNSIMIHTNMRKSELFGTYKGGHYTYEAPDGYQIVGFFGRSGGYVDALGVLIQKIQP